MATLPDLDTSQIGVIAFWNAHDHRVDPASGATIDPTDVLGVLKSYTLYDNGIDGTIDYGPRTDINVRVKNDGWIIAWIDRENTYQLNVDSYAAKGYYDLLYNWKAISNISANTNTLIEVVNHLYNQLTNAADFSFSKSDVGIYCYEYPSSVSTTFADQYLDTYAEGKTTDYLKFTVTSGTKLYYAVLTGRVYNPSGATYTIYVRYDRDGTIIAGGTNLASYTSRYGTYDVINVLPYNTEETVTCYGQTTYSSLHSHGSMILIWE